MAPRMLCLALCLLVVAAPAVRAADRPAGLLGKCATTLAARALESRNPALMADVAALLEARVFDDVAKRSGQPWDLSSLKRELAVTAMSDAGAPARDAIARLMNDPIMTSLFPVFGNEVPVGSAQLGRIGAKLALHAFKTPDPALKAALAKVLAAHVFEKATREHDSIWDVRTFKQIVSMWAMSPDAEAVRGELSLLLNNGPAMASLFMVFEER